ncbi:hypothetical protein QBC32DRAFT_225966, partial [Pseudoneurospora amorphoporcata]
QEGLITKAYGKTVAYSDYLTFIIQRLYFAKYVKSFSRMRQDLNLYLSLVLLTDICGRGCKIARHPLHLNHLFPRQLRHCGRQNLQTLQSTTRRLRRLPRYSDLPPIGQRITEEPDQPESHHKKVQTPARPPGQYHGQASQKGAYRMDYLVTSSYIDMLAELEQAQASETHTAAVLLR